MNPIDWIKNKSKFTLFQEIFPSEFVEDNFIITPDGYISSGFELILPANETLEENAIIATQNTLEKVFSRLPEGTTIHLQTQYGYTQNSLRALEEARKGLLMYKMAEHLMDRPILKSRSFMYLTFPIKPNNKALNPLNTLLAQYKKINNPIKNIEQHKARIKGYTQTFINQFASVPNIKIRQLNTQELKNEIIRYRTLNFFENDINTRSVDYHNMGNKIAIGTQFAGFVYLNKPDKTIYYTSKNNRGIDTFMTWPLGFNLDFPHIVNLGIIIGNEKTLDKLNFKKKLSTQSEAENGHIAEDIENFIQYVRKNGKKPVYMSHNVMAWASNTDELSYRLDLINSAYIKMNGSHAVQDSFNAANFYFAFCPGYAQNMVQTLIMDCEDAVLHFDFTKEETADQKGIILCNRNLEPVLIDFWSDYLVNKNKICIGPSGSGKSFFWNTFLSQCIEKGEEVILLDIGGSYKNLFNLYKNAKYIETANDETLTFNPFLTPKDQYGNYTLTDEKINFLLNLISLLWKQTDKEEYLNRIEETILTEMLTAYYHDINLKKEKKPRLDSFVEFTCQKMRQNKNNELEYFNINSFERIISSFTGDSKRGKLLNSNENIDTAGYQLVCFDLYGINDDPRLYPIVSLIIIELIMDKISRSLRQRKQIVIDEAWRMLSGSMGKFIEGVFRTCRKYNASINLITQTIIELSESSVGEAIKANAGTKIILDHSSEYGQVQKIKEFFGLTDHAEELIRSIRKGPTWREVFIQRGSLNQVFAVDVGPHATKAFSSEGPDRAEMARLTKIGGPAYAVNQIVENMYK